MADRARLELDMRMTVGLIQPGVDAQAFFGITNHFPAALQLYPGTKVCQRIVKQTPGEAKYMGRYGRG